MMFASIIRKSGIVFVFVLTCLSVALAQDTKPGDAKNSPGPAPQAPVVDTLTDSVLVTVVLKYQQDKNFAELRRLLEAQGFWDMFPISEARVVSWNIAIGLGHIITLKMPAGSVRRLNLAIQNGAWGAFNSDIYLSYEYLPIWKDYIERREDAKAEREKD
jgi:hypothetical protein